MPAASSARRDAILAGLTTYRTGKPCRRGHVSERFVSNHSCVECKRLNDALFSRRRPERRREIARFSQRKLYAKQRDAVLAKNRAWRARNKEKVEQSAAVYREHNREQANNTSRRWRKANPAKVREHSNRYRVRKLKADGFHTLEDTIAIRKDQKDRCAFCRARLRGKGHLDHINPLSRGGSDWPKNLQWLCMPCNVSKSARDQISWAQSKGRLL